MLGAAELQRAREGAPAPLRDVDRAAVSERLGQLLRPAAEEAAEVTATGVDEAERIVAEALEEAQARLSNVATLRAAAAAAAEQADRDRAEAAELLARARPSTGAPSGQGGGASTSPAAGPVDRLPLASPDAGPPVSVTPGGVQVSAGRR